MMACEEAWLLGQAMRAIDPQAVLVLGPVPTSGGEDEVFRNSLTGKQTFVIKAEKVPNAAGVRRVLEMLGGPQAGYADLVAGAAPELKKLKGGWIVGGYLSNWLPKEQPALFKRGYKVVQDVLASTLSDAADVLLPGAMWAEKDGTWENYQGKLQVFAAAVPPPEGARRDAEVYLALLERTGYYQAEAIRREMGEPFASLQVPLAGVEEPAFEFQEL
jgi:anaerobic selenocysteine-containing dehydrogenase